MAPAVPLWSSLVDELGIRAQVTFTGVLSSVTAQLCRADVYLSTSLSEGMSNALLEAMSFGLMPVISAGQWRRRPHRSGPLGAALCVR